MRESELRSVAHANLLFSFFLPLLWLRCAFLALTLLQTCDYCCTICVCLCFRSSLLTGPDWTELNRTSEMDGMRASHLSIFRLTATDRPIPALPAPNNTQADQCAGAGSARHHLPTHLPISPSLYPSPQMERSLPYHFFPSYSSHSI